MTIHTYLHKATAQLDEAGVGTARLDVLVLLEDCLGEDRAHLLAHPETSLTVEQLKILDRQINSRVTHEPLAYIRGKTEFYGRKFLVNKNVLEPRPESETMIDMLKELSGITQGTILDIGTGSGALAITAKLETPSAEVIAIDIDPNCLEITLRNATALGSSIHVLESDLLSKLPTLGSTHCTLLCNLPYVPEDFQINTAASHEPRLAIFGGEDGLDLYRKLFKQLQGLEHKPQHVLTESLPQQHAQLAEIAGSHGYELKETRDFIQLYDLVT